MKALRYKDQQLDVADVPRPDVNGEALVRVTLSGICNTDLEIARGYAGFQGTLGHEFVGVIESVRAIAYDNAEHSSTRTMTRIARATEIAETTAGVDLADNPSAWFQKPDRQRGLVS